MFAPARPSPADAGHVACRDAAVQVAENVRVGVYDHGDGPVSSGGKTLRPSRWADATIALPSRFGKRNALDETAAAGAEVQRARHDYLVKTGGGRARSHVTAQVVGQRPEAIAAAESFRVDGDQAEPVDVRKVQRRVLASQHGAEDLDQQTQSKPLVAQLATKRLDRSARGTIKIFRVGGRTSGGVAARSPAATACCQPGARGSSLPQSLRLTCPRQSDHRWWARRRRADWWPGGLGYRPKARPSGRASNCWRTPSQSAPPPPASGRRSLADRHGGCCG